MTKRRYGHSTSGKPIDDDLIEELAEPAEAGYDVDEVIARRGKRGRPRLDGALHRRVRVWSPSRARPLKPPRSR